MQSSMCHRRFWMPLFLMDDLLLISRYARSKITSVIIFRLSGCRTDSQCTWSRRSQPGTAEPWSRCCRGPRRSPTRPRSQQPRVRAWTGRTGARARRSRGSWGRQPGPRRRGTQVRGPPCGTWPQRLPGWWTTMMSCCLKRSEMTWPLELEQVQLGVGTDIAGRRGQQRRTGLAGSLGLLVLGTPRSSTGAEIRKKPYFTLFCTYKIWMFIGTRS